MHTFDSTTEKIEFLKKYKLVSKTASELPVFYYFKPGSDTPITCEVIGYEDAFDNWACITISANNEVINIHSDFLLEMKKKGVSFYKNNSPTPDEENIENAYVVFDIETTGRNYKKDQIIEISAIKCTEKKIYEFSELVHTESIIPIDITLLTGINNETLEEADPIEVVLPKFMKFIGSHKLVGHNIKAFDIHFINKACQDLELPVVKNELLDTLQLSREILPDLDNHKLSTICDFYNIDSSNAHRALADCYMCNECYKNMLSDDTPPINEVEVSDEDASNSPFEKNILSLLNEIIVDLELPPKGLVLQRNRGKRITTASIYINEPPYPATKDDYEKINTTQSILKFQEKDDVVILTIREIAFDECPCPENIPYKDKKKFVEVSFPISNPELYTYIKKIILFRIKYYISSANTFSCCSQFNACSDARKCVHENKLYSTACSYRRNLESGRIFYGKNRNVD